MHVCRWLRSLDSEFSGHSGIVAPDGQRSIVATRQTQVLELMRCLESNGLKMVARPIASGVARPMASLTSSDSGFLFDGGNGLQQNVVDDHNYDDSDRQPLVCYEMHPFLACGHIQQGLWPMTLLC